MSLASGKILVKRVAETPWPLNPRDDEAALKGSEPTLSTFWAQLVVFVGLITRCSGVGYNPGFIVW